MLSHVTHAAWSIERVLGQLDISCTSPCQRRRTRPLFGPSTITTTQRAPKRQSRVNRGEGLAPKGPSTIQFSRRTVPSPNPRGSDSTWQLRLQCSHHGVSQGSNPKDQENSNNHLTGDMPLMTTADDRSRASKFIQLANSFLGLPVTGKGTKGNTSKPPLRRFPLQESNDAVSCVPYLTICLQAVRQRVSEGERTRDQ